MHIAQNLQADFAQVRILEDLATALPAFVNGTQHNAEKRPPISLAPGCSQSLAGPATPSGMHKTHFAIYYTAEGNRESIVWMEISGRPVWSSAEGR